jgi:phosphate-selective porin OprO and OprP
MSKYVWSAISALSLCFTAGAAEAREGLHFGSTGITYEAPNFEFNLGGRLHLDAARVDDGATSTDDTEVRRARLELSMRFFDDWRFRLDREFTKGGGWRNVWLSYDMNDRFSVKAGNFIAPFSMEDVGSSNESMFMERSLTQALAPGFGVGVAATYRGEHFTVSGGYFGDAIDAEDNIQASKGRGFDVRGTWSPIERRSQVLHFGVGFDRREFQSGDTRLISSKPEASLAPTLVTTGTIANPDTTTSYNVEAAYSVGPVLFQGQYISTDLRPTVGPSIKLNGYYAQVGWVVTGERHRYSSAGVFTGPHPEGAWGALEVAARYSNLDLSEGPAASRGEARDGTAGVTWYLNDNLRFMANYVHSELNAVTPAFDRDVDVVEGRVQIDF